MARGAPLRVKRKGEKEKKRKEKTRKKIEKKENKSPHTHEVSAASLRLMHKNDLGSLVRGFKLRYSSDLGD